MILKTILLEAFFIGLASGATFILDKFSEGEISGKKIRKAKRKPQSSGDRSRGKSEESG